jgi:hypothetical protein
MAQSKRVSDDDDSEIDSEGEAERVETAVSALMETSLMFRVRGKNLKTRTEAEDGN